jgi:hypothetical protein
MGLKTWKWWVQMKVSSPFPNHTKKKHNPESKEPHSSPNSSQMTSLYCRRASIVWNTCIGQIVKTVLHVADLWVSACRYMVHSKNWSAKIAPFSTKVHKWGQHFFRV